MGSCLMPSKIIKRDHLQMNESHLLSDDNHIGMEENNLYREFQTETSVTNNSNLNPIYPSNHSSPQHHSNDNIHLLKLNNDLQRQIDVLKQCSNDEIKILKQRIQFLENQFHGLSSSNHHPITAEYKQQHIVAIECDKNTPLPIKSCPYVMRIIKISKLYNDMMASSKKFDENELWNSVSTEYNLNSLIADYRHILEVHCNNNNIFELRMTYLEINDLMNDTCKQLKCECIEHIKHVPFEMNTHCILNLVHCFLYHQNDKNNFNDSSSMQRLNDCIMDKNEIILKYDSTHDQANTLKKLRHGSINSVISNLSRRSTSKSSVSRISSLSEEQPNECGEMKKLFIGTPQPHNIEMSQNRVRKLSGQINENELKQMLNEYMDDDALDDGVISPSEDSSLNENDRAEIENFKLKMDYNIDNKERRGSKSNLFKEQQESEWNVDEINQTAKDMKEQLFQLALGSQ